MKIVHFSILSLASLSMFTSGCVVHGYYEPYHPVVYSEPLPPPPPPVILPPPAPVTVQVVTYGPPDFYYWVDNDCIGFSGGTYVYFSAGVWLPCDRARVERFHYWRSHNSHWREHGVRHVDGRPPVRFNDHGGSPRGNPGPRDYRR